MYDVYILCYLIWGISEVLLSLLLRAKGNGVKQMDKGSLSYLWITIGICIFLAVYISKTTAYSLYNGILFDYIGLVLILIGVVFRMLVVRYLGKYFTVNVAISTDHILIKKGYYKYVRHPSYSFSLLSFLGFAISLNNWLSSLIVVIPVFTAFVYRMHIEEKALIAGLGEPYVQYMRHTKRILPFVY